jgi:hypothetical protein
MAIVGYEGAVNGVAALTVAPAWEFMANGTRRAYIRELGFFNQAATAAAKQIIGRPGNTPTVGAVILGSAQDPANAAATAGFTVTWTTAPTVPALAMRQFDFPATIGSAVIFTWPPDGELIVGPTRLNSVIQWNASGSTIGIMSVYGVWSE